MGNLIEQSTKESLRTLQDKGKAYITLSASSASGGITSIFAGRAPVLNVTVRESVDYSTFKSLAGDYLIATFGHSLSMITISGLDLCNHGCDNSGQTIQDFYSRNNVATRPRARVHLNISSGHSSSGTFDCVLTDLTMQANGGEAGGNRYELQLVGVQRR